MVFTIGTKTTECVGHGDYLDVVSVRSLDPYGRNFPPVFGSLRKAKEFMEMQPEWKHDSLEIVTLELRA